MGRRRVLVSVAIDFDASSCMYDRCMYTSVAAAENARAKVVVMHIVLV